MLTADSYTLLEGDFEEDDGVESKSEQQGEVSVSVRSSSSSSFTLGTSTPLFWRISIAQLRSDSLRQISQFPLSP